MKIKSFPKHFYSFVLNFTTPRYAMLFLNSENYIMHVINHEWNRFMFVASAMCFVWFTKPNFPTIGIRARFSYHACITCDWVLEFKKTVIFVFSNFCMFLPFITNWLSNWAGLLGLSNWAGLLGFSNWALMCGLEWDQKRPIRH